MTNSNKDFVIYPMYKVINDKVFIYLFGKLDSRELFLTINEFKPYFFIEKKDEKKAKEVIETISKEITGSIDLIKTDFVNFNKKQMSKITIPKEIQKLSHSIDYDHYIDKKIRPIADSVFIFFDTNLDDLVKGSVQKDLFSL